MGKIAKLRFLKIPQKAIRAFISIGHPLQNNGSIAKIKKVVFWRLYFQNENYWHFLFLMNQILGKVLSYLKSWGIGINYFWNNWLSKLLLQFIEYYLDQLNNKHMKITENSRKIFWKSLLKEISGKSLKFFSSSTIKWRPFQVLQNWTKTIF